MQRRGIALSAALACLLATAPSPSTSWRVVRAAGSAIDPLAPALAALALCAWALLAWLSLVCAAVLLARAPGVIGGAGRLLSRSVAPRAVRRTVELALGMTVAVTAVTALPAVAAAPSPSPVPTATTPAPPGAPSSSPTSGPTWDLDWPITGSSPLASAAPEPSASPVPSAAGVPDSSPEPRSPPVPSRPAAPAPVRPPTLAPLPTDGTRAPSDQPAGPRSGDTVVVRPGDTLWHLSADALRAAGDPHPTNRRIAQAWPAFWQANREVVGDDPDLILPGTRLAVPELPGPSV